MDLYKQYDLMQLYNLSAQRFPFTQKGHYEHQKS